LQRPFTEWFKEENVMTTRPILFAAAALVAAFALQGSAQALTLTECSVKYKDAKAAGTLNGATWNDFRKSQCDASGAGGAPQASGGSGCRDRCYCRCRFPERGGLKIFE